MGWALASSRCRCGPSKHGRVDVSTLPHRLCVAIEWWRSVCDGFHCDAMLRVTVTSLSTDFLPHRDGSVCNFIVASTFFRITGPNSVMIVTCLTTTALSVSTPPTQRWGYVSCEYDPVKINEHSLNPARRLEPLDDDCCLRRCVSCRRHSGVVGNHGGAFR